MTVKNTIEQKLTDNLQIEKLEVIDDSASHAGHAGYIEGGETHFNVTVISTDFAGKSKVIRHKMIYKILDEELKGRVHALSISALAPGE